MSTENDTPTDTDDLSDLSNEELLERVAALDEDTYPIATRARQALADHSDEEDESA